MAPRTFYIGPHSGLPEAPPGLTGYVEPALGKGFLKYYPYMGYPDQGSLEFTLWSSQPWHNTGLQPFAWDMLPPIPWQSTIWDARTRPVIRLVLGRLVRCLVKENGRPSSTFKAKGKQYEAPGGIDLYPEIQIFRPQDDALIPQPGEEIEVFRFLPSPSLEGAPGVGWASGAERGPGGDALTTLARIVHRGDQFVVTPQPLGVEIRSKRYQVVISVDPYRGGAYAYELLLPENKSEPPQSVTLRIVYTDGVSIKATGMRDSYPFKVEATQVPLPASNVEPHVDFVPPLVFVPPQGTSLPPEDFLFDPVKIDLVGPDLPSPWQFFLELSIGFIPYVGDFYFISQFTYAAITGKDFFGHEVGEGELWIMGIAAILPIPLSKLSGAVAAWRAELRATPLARIARALDEGFTLEAQRIMGVEFRVAVGKIEPKDAARIARLLTQCAGGKLDPDKVLKAFHELINEPYLIELAKRRVEQALTADLRNFRDETLASGYNNYVSKQKGAHTGVIEWALKQNRNGRYYAELERELGGDFKNMLRDSRKNTLLNPKPLSAEELAHYDRLIARIEDWGTLSKVNKGHGRFFELDHNPEQRFFRNDPRVHSFDEKSLGMVIPVPKNPAVASRMPGRPIQYVHTLKTRMLADLIPNGREAEFTVQQIWDAHAFVLQALGVDKSTILSQHFTHNFSVLAELRGEKQLPYFRLVTSKDFDSIFSRPRWPIFPGSIPALSRFATSEVLGDDSER